MPLKLNVGLNKKIGLPNYSSLGASCHVEVELESAILQHDLDGFYRQARNAFLACRQAITDELDRQRAIEPVSNGDGHAARSASSGNTTQREASDRTRRATTSQARALDAIARRRQLDLASLLSERFHVAATEDLSIVEASRLIDELNLPAESNGVR